MWSARHWSGIGGLILVLALGAVLAAGQSVDLPPALPWLILLSGVGIGLIGGLVALGRPPAPEQAPLPRDDFPPADGVVGLASMRGVRAEPNGCDPEFQRFVALDPSIQVALQSLVPNRRTPPLLGRIVWISLFVGRDGRGWSEAEIAEAHASLRRAGVWLEREAVRWNAPVNVELAETYFETTDDAPDEVEIEFVPEGDDFGPSEAHNLTKALALMSRAAARLGFRDAQDLIARTNPRVEADQRVWLVHPRRAGRSIAVPLTSSELDGVSLALCYAREASFPEPLRGAPYTDPVTVAHELLHLFGATDKYNLPLSDFPKASVTARDIMRLHFETLSRLRIDPGTAVEIGWCAAGPDLPPSPTKNDRRPP